MTLEAQKYKPQLTVPSNCPMCNYPLEWEGVHLICRGPRCIAKLIQRIDYFYSEHGMALNEIGSGRVEKLLLDPECFVVLSEKPWALLDPYTYGIYQRLGQVLGHGVAKNIYTNITEINNTKNAAHFISGMGIEKVGFKTAYRLFNYIRYSKLHYKISKEAQQNFITGLTQFYLAQKEMVYFNFCDVPPPAQILYAITGTLKESRNDMKVLLDTYGWEYSDTVTKQVDFLIIGDSPGKNKPFRADRYKVEMITENDLYKRLKEG